MAWGKFRVFGGSGVHEQESRFCQAKPESLAPRTTFSAF